LLQNHGLMNFLTYATLVQELFVPLLLFIPWKTWLFRLICVVTFIGFHTGLGLCMRLGTFQPLCIAMWLGMIPTEFGDWLGRRLRNPRRDVLVLYRDAASGPQLESVRLWTTLLLIGDTPVRTAQEFPERLEQVRKEGTWIAVEGKGKLHAGFEAVLLLVRVSPVFWPLAYPLGWMAKGSEKKHAPHRRADNESVPPPRPDLPPAVMPLSGPVNLLVGVFIVYGFLWNIRTWHEPHRAGENVVGRSLLGLRDVVKELAPSQTM